nr:adenylyl cyclase X E isoform X1 [Bactrocera oleae]XP_036214808.1 adenylyl cyclase X E isoform X1 [Bactrocera oleae]XP_036214815.1 adenylyl cyclase X E isoform X1 [Bactrocera oleae]XP_036214816.1 adenylyl cyclase X E isoform X1 [Bactrocera oleae]XP_036214822.1 adenylyl cyclase X E isoform X1 [Bactrocera oleae]
MNAFLESSTEATPDHDEGHQTKLVNQKQWELGYLKRKCRNLELEQYYVSYMNRLRLSHLGLFIFVLILIAIVHSLLIIITFPKNENRDIYLDIGIYMGCTLIILIVLLFNFRLTLNKRYEWLTFSSIWLAISTLVVMDISIPIYRAVKDYNIIVPTYYSFIIYATYIFMPITEDVHAFILGVAVSFCYMILFLFVTYRRRLDGSREMDLPKIISEAIFMACVNLLGLFFRLTREVAIRTTFLDKRQCVEETLVLRAARDQEKSLLLSIIPAQIANKIEEDVKMRIEHLKKSKKNRRSTHDEVGSTPTPLWRQMDTEKLFIEPHNDVSILYADVVNYTYLTTTLDVKTLVETLHDLFVKFDTASQEYDVLRIKFLGDCYYCVAGVPLPNEYHARSCVYLGLRMIKDIRDVRSKRKLDIDMRIGVHSGNILSGVIGANKWQFDIWSKDVDIANRLESTGEAGRVHVSGQTLQQLDGEFIYEEGTAKARDDPVLRKYEIHTFLIKPPSSRVTSFITMRRPPSSLRKNLERKSGADQRNEISTNFMQNSISQYNQIRNQATLEMSREVDKMPIGRIQVSKLCFGHEKRLTQDEMEGQIFRSNITSVCLFFKDWRWELMFMKQPDFMLKYSVLVSYITLVCAIVMQAVNSSPTEAFWALVAVGNVLMLLLLALVWYKKLWIMFISETELSRPKQSFSKWLYKLSDGIQSNILVRSSIYLVVIILHSTGIILQLLDCNKSAAVEEAILGTARNETTCFNAWAVTECFMLSTCITFLFTRIPFVLKASVGIMTLVFYTVVVTLSYSYVYGQSLSTNDTLYPEYSHIFVMCISVGIFHLMDRQTEFIAKVDYNWKRQLLKKQDDAKFTNETISILINNILPSHVADIYMSRQMTNELYYEEYDNVAVMFATIRNYDTEQVGIRVLNEIICDFDEVLSTYTGTRKVEKIKVAGWTYMAACGLDPKRSEHRKTQTAYRSSSLLPNGRRSHYSSRQHDIDEEAQLGDDEQPTTSRQADVQFIRLQEYEGHNKKTYKSEDYNDVVFVMLQFALELMRTMKCFNVENLQCEADDEDCGALRIGISNGPVMAGVVGSYKPHYDIWGNAVNMASRMDSTGIAGSIQVTQNTAKILESYNVKCTYRGLTFVKGRGHIPTYIVNVYESLHFVKIREEDDVEEETTSNLDYESASC